MGIFSAIRDANFGHHTTAQPSSAPEQQPATAHAAPAQATVQPATPASASAPQPHGEAMQQVDLEKVLDARPGAGNLNWRTSIVDLMKLVGIDSSYDNRKQLATELGRQDYSGSAEDNEWLHQRTMEELAKNGAKVPASLQA
jgi:3-oxoacyl-ACP reductase-like protein